MTKKKLLGMFVVALACLMVSTFVIALLFTSAQPTYGGRQLGYWFKRLPIKEVSGSCTVTEQCFPGYTASYGRMIAPGESLTALRAIGTNALPFLLYKLNRSESPLTTWVREGADKWGIKTYPFQNPEFERAQAVTALVALSPLPPLVLRHIANLSTNKNANVAYSADVVLRANTPPQEANMYVPHWENAE